MRKLITKFIPRAALFVINAMVGVYALRIILFCGLGVFLAHDLSRIVFAFRHTFLFHAPRTVYHDIYSLLFYDSIVILQYHAYPALFSVIGCLWHYYVVAVFPVFMSATVSGLINRKTKFLTTPKGKTDKLGFWQLWPWHVMILLNILAIGVNLADWYNLSWPIYINMIWCTYHIVILSTIYRLNKLPKLPTNPLYAN